MENILFKYFENRYKEASNSLNPNPSFGPVITLSRQAGCEARKIGDLLVHELNTKQPHKKWHCVDKELLIQSARELNLSSAKIEHFLNGHENNKFVDVFAAFSKSHVNDVKIKKTLKDVLLSLCREGNLVLVGRAAAAILQDKPNTLNIRLTAPFGWRIDSILKNKRVSVEAAEEWAIETDENRHKLFYTFLEKRPGNLDYLFDASLNRKHFSITQTVELIMHMAKTKGLIN